jgi:hypothetical protein
MGTSVTRCPTHVAATIRCAALLTAHPPLQLLWAEHHRVDVRMARASQRQPRTKATLLVEVVQGKLPGLGMAQTLSVAKHVPVPQPPRKQGRGRAPTHHTSPPSSACASLCEHVCVCECERLVLTTYNPARDRDAATVMRFSIFTNPRALALLDRTRDTST